MCLEIILLLLICNINDFFSKTAIKVLLMYIHRQMDTKQTLTTTLRLRFYMEPSSLNAKEHE